MEAGRLGAPWCLYTLTAYAAATAMLLSRQKPWEPWGSLAQVTTPAGPAWCPGGRTAQNAFCACMHAAHKDPARPSATCHRLLYDNMAILWLPVCSHEAHEGIASYGWFPYAAGPVDPVKKDHKERVLTLGCSDRTWPPMTASTARHTAPAAASAAPKLPCEMAVSPSRWPMAPGPLLGSAPAAACYANGPSSRDRHRQLVPDQSAYTDSMQTTHESVPSDLLLHTQDVEQNRVQASAMVVAMSCDVCAAGAQVRAAHLQLAHVRPVVHTQHVCKWRVRAGLVPGQAGKLPSSQHPHVCKRPQRSSAQGDTATWWWRHWGGSPLCDDQAPQGPPASSTGEPG